LRYLKEIAQDVENARDQSEPRFVWPSLVKYAVHLQNDCRLDQALDVLDTALALSDGRDAVEELDTLLRRGKVLLLDSRPGEAYEVYALAEAMAERLPGSQESSKLLTRVGIGAALRDLDKLTEASQVLDGARLAAAHGNHRDAWAEACRELAITYERMGRLHESMPLRFCTFQLLTDSVDRGREIVSVAGQLRRLGWNDAARDAFTIATSPEFEDRVQIRAMLGLLEVNAQCADRMGFERVRRRLRSLSEELEPEDNVGLEVSLGKGYAQFGCRGLPEKHFRKAIELAGQHELADEKEYAADLLAQTTADGLFLHESKTRDYPDDRELDFIARRLRELVAELRS